MYALLLSLVVAVNAGAAVDTEGTVFTVDTDHVRWVIGKEGKALSLWDKDEEEELLALEEQQAFSSVILEGKTLPATAVLPAEQGYTVRYGDTDIEAQFQVEIAADYFSLSLLSVYDERVETE